jgi:hypothetical protein
MTAVTHFPNIEAAEKVMQGMEDGLRAALPQLDAVLAEPSPSSPTKRWSIEPPGQRSTNDEHQHG